MAESTKQICLNYQSDGFCRLGDKCSFAHVDTPKKEVKEEYPKETTPPPRTSISSKAVVPKKATQSRTPVHKDIVDARYFCPDHRSNRHCVNLNRGCPGFHVGKDCKTYYLTGQCGYGASCHYMHRRLTTSYEQRPPPRRIASRRVTPPPSPPRERRRREERRATPPRRLARSQSPRRRPEREVEDRVRDKRRRMPPELDRKKEKYNYQSYSEREVTAKVDKAYLQGLEDAQAIVEHALMQIHALAQKKGLQSQQLSVRPISPE